MTVKLYNLALKVFLNKWKIENHKHLKTVYKDIICIWKEIAFEISFKINYGLGMKKKENIEKHEICWKNNKKNV